MNFSPSKNLPQASIYLVDDSQAVYNSLAMLLAGYDIELLFFEDFQTLITASRNKMPDCLLIELNLQPDNGLEIYQSLKQQNIKPKTIFLATYSDISTAVKIMRAGAIDFIQKPYTDVRIIESIHTAIDLNQYYKK